MDAFDRGSYERDGFVMLRGLFPGGALRRFEDRFVELASGARVAPEGMVVMQDVMVARGVVAPASRIHGVNKILSFEDDPVLFGYALDSALLDAVRMLIGPDVVTISTNVFNKPPGIDGRHPLHQDLRYFSLRPPGKIVGTWTALSRCTRENGCLALVPGSHRRELLPHGTPGWEHVNSGFFAAEGVDRTDRVHVEMEPGDTLLFHPLLVHGSGRNTTDGFRRAISTHYASAACGRPSGRSARELVVRHIPPS